MFFGEEDPLSIHTVACAGLDLVNNLAERQSKKTFISSMLDAVVENRRKQMLDFFRRPQNFLKHADKDPDDVLEYHPEVVEYYILFACNSYLELTGETTPEIRGFMIWFSLVHPDILTLPALKEHAEKYVKEWGMPKSSKDKRLMLDSINAKKVELSND